MITKQEEKEAKEDKAWKYKRKRTRDKKMGVYEIRKRKKSTIRKNGKRKMMTEKKMKRERRRRQRKRGRQRN